MESPSLDQGQQEPDKVTVIVHGGKNLQSKKKGRCKFSVIFGIGAKKFRTDVVEDVFGSPVWNTEAEIDVDDASLNLNLIATEKDEPLGQIIIPLNEMGSLKPYQGKKVSLGAHKKAPEPVGEVIVSAWISATRAPREAKASPSGALKSLKKMKSKISHSPLMRRKHKNGDSVQPGSMKGSMSMGDIAGMGRRKTNLMTVPSDSMCSVNSTDSDTSSQYTASCVDIRENLKKPEVSGISPKEGPVEGGTRLTIRGLNLGRSKEDIKGLYVCGCNCLSSLEYESTSKLYCVTGKSKAGPGDIVVETVSGGKGSSMVQFVYTQKDGSSASPMVTKRLSPLIGRGKSPMLTHKKRSSDTSMLSTGSIPEEEPRPEVSGVSPKEGPLEGGTRLTIRGDNLGQGPGDICAISVCGKDCIDTLEYDSPRKLYVTTKAWKPCTGNIIVETKSAGKGISNVQFTYLQPPASPSLPKGVMDGHRLSVDMDPEMLHKYSTPSPAFSEDDDDDNLLKPEVTGISPKEGPIEGNTRLTIRGLNLGRNRNDVIGLTICGANCLPMLEYESPMKLYCTTLPWKPGSGAIIVETYQGGKGTSLVQYTFKLIPQSIPPSPSGVASSPKLTPAGGAAVIPAKPPRKTPSFTSSASSLELSEGVPDQRVAPQISVTEATPQRDVQTLSHPFSNVTPPPSPEQAHTVPVLGVTVDETDDFGGATPYPDEARGVDARTRTGTAASPVPVSSARQSRASPVHDVPPNSVSSVANSNTRPQPVGEEPKMSPSKEQKRKAPSPPSHQKPPVYPSNQKPASPGNPSIQKPASPGNQGSDSGRQVTVTVHNRQLPTPPSSDNTDDSVDALNVKNTENESDLRTRGNNILAKMTGLDKKEKYMKEQQQEQMTQSGPTRQELMEEIRRVKLDNRELREQNHMMKQYLENLLSHVMLRCPEVLCVDHGNPGNK